MQKVSKNFIKFRQYIRTLSLSINEQYLLELFFEFHNTQYGYCFLKVSDILKAFNTTSKNRILNVIKSLEEKELITVDRENKNNRYYIKNIDAFITGNIQEVKAGAENKMTGEEAFNPDITLTKKQVKEHLKDNQTKMNLDTTEENIKLNKVKLVVKNVSNELIEVVKNTDENIVDIAIAANIGKKVNSKYFIKAIEYAAKKEVKNVKSFNNFEAREYNYDKLEAMLLGHEKYNENDIHDVLSNSKLYNGIQVGA